MKRMLIVMLLFALGGCTATFPYARKATESLKQSQALVEDNLEKAQVLVQGAARKHVVEAAGHARAVTTYVGSPIVRMKTVQPENDAVLETSTIDATLPDPTAAELVEAGAEEAMPWLDLALGLAALFGVGGALRYRKQAHILKDAVVDTVNGIEAGEAILTEEYVDALHDELSKAQDKSTKAIVAKVKAGKGV
jgi:hypothetical protein